MEKIYFVIAGAMAQPLAAALWDCLASWWLCMEKRKVLQEMHLSNARENQQFMWINWKVEDETENPRGFFSIDVSLPIDRAHFKEAHIKELADIAYYGALQELSAESMCVKVPPKDLIGKAEPDHGEAWALTTRGKRRAKMYIFLKRIVNRGLLYQ